MKANGREYLSLKDTNVLKGIAVLLLLWHHLFYVQNGLFDDILLSGDTFLVNKSGKVCKMCVAIFVFLSGYGLTRQAEVKGGLGKLSIWYRHRYTKLMSNYWLIWLLFVPVGVFIFGRTLSDAYQNQVAWKLLADVLGMANAFGFHGYNATWWFITCIILLYAIYPLLYKVGKWNVIAILMVGLIGSFLPVKTGASSVHPYLFPFVFGMVAAIKPIQMGGVKYVALLALPILIAARIWLGGKVIADSLIALSMTYILLSNNIPETVKNTFAFLGKHSMNIFLFHTFIFSHWFKTFIYSPRNPILIFLLLLTICVIISLGVEHLKKSINFSKLTS